MNTQKRGYGVAAYIRSKRRSSPSAEMYELAHEERVRLAAHVVDRAAGRGPVLAAGTFGESISAHAEAVKRIADTGVAAAVLAVNQLALESESDAIWQRNAAALILRGSQTP